jgi:hypothetical protein
LAVAASFAGSIAAGAPAGKPIRAAALTSCLRQCYVECGARIAYSIGDRTWRKDRRAATCVMGVGFSIVG